MDKHDPMGDRMKLYEKVETYRKCDPSKPICIRLDGRAFSTFTKGLGRPYDERMSRLMVDTTKFLVNETQSDEITLVYAYEEQSQPLFGGKLHKLTSLLAGMCSAKFAAILGLYLPEKVDKSARGWESSWMDGVPSFDARVFQVPSKVEAANVVLWRWFDARKNSVSMLAQSIFSHKQLQNKNAVEMKQMCLEKEHDWDKYPDFFKWGTFVQRKTVERELSQEELALIPERHRPAMGQLVNRSRVVNLEMPAFIDVANRVGVIFDGEAPSLVQPI